VGRVLVKHVICPQSNRRGGKLKERDTARYTQRVHTFLFMRWNKARPAPTAATTTRTDTETPAIFLPFSSLSLDSSLHVATRDQAARHCARSEFEAAYT
jgi:hypothetical protein